MKSFKELIFQKLTQLTLFIFITVILANLMVFLIIKLVFNKSSDISFLRANLTTYVLSVNSIQANLHSKYFIKSILDEQNRYVMPVLENYKSEPWYSRFKEVSQDVYEFINQPSEPFAREIIIKADDLNRELTKLDIAYRNTASITVIILIVLNIAFLILMASVMIYYSSRLAQSFAEPLSLVSEHIGKVIAGELYIKEYLGNIEIRELHDIFKGLEKLKNDLKRYQESNREFLKKYNELVKKLRELER